jgi:hypothetical protein
MSICHPPYEESPFPEDETYQDKKIIPKYPLTVYYMKNGKRIEIEPGSLEKILKKQTF